MVWCGAEGCAEIIFQPPGCKVDASSYQLILSKAALSAGQLLFCSSSWLFVRGGSPVHTARSIQRWLQLHGIDFGKTGWSPSSLDLNPLDFCVWVELERRICCKPHRNLESLKRVLFSPPVCCGNPVWLC